jgi:hypothetical protein
MPPTAEYAVVVLPVNAAATSIPADAIVKLERTWLVPVPKLTPFDEFNGVVESTPLKARIVNVP